MSAAPDWIAADWGTSNLRAWLMRSGASPQLLRRDRGMGGLSPKEFEGALLDLVGPYLGNARTPVIVCGMAGARHGWVEAPYAAVPCVPPSMDQAVHAPTQDPRLQVWVLPGVKQDKPADVMRGEETQIAGFLDRAPHFDGILVLPGTHTKWVHISAGEIVSFRTFMTDELFALLSERSVLRHSVQGALDNDAFEAAVDDAMSNPQMLAASLFGLRAQTLLAGLAPQQARGRLSGLLIGVEMAGARPYWLGQNVALIGASKLCALYARALSRQGVQATIAQGDAMVLAGLAAAYASKETTA